jgi:hypothetical protein
MTEAKIARPIDCLLIADGTHHAPREQKLHCVCGARDFELHYPGPGGSHGDADAAGPVEAVSWCARAVCAVCAREYRIHTPGEPAMDCCSLSPSEFALWSCADCQGRAHRVMVDVVSLDVADASEGSGSRWFTVFSTCAQCGRENARWIALEQRLPY